MDYMSTDFGANSWNRFPLAHRQTVRQTNKQTHRQTDRRDWTLYPTPAAIQPAWVIKEQHTKSIKSIK